MADTKPWLADKAWRDNRISSGAKYAHWVLAGFALIWNLITLPMFWQLPALIRRVPAEPLLALVFLFPLLGLGLIWTSWLYWQRWRKFGPTPLVLDPFPGAIGGQVGGIVDTAIAFKPGQLFAVTLSCLRSSVSGSGKNRSRSESIKWQNAGVCHSEASDSGTRLRFRFEVPTGLPSSDTSKSGSYYLWRVAITSELDGPDFERRFEIPVYPTAAVSSIEQATESHAATIDVASDGVESIADITAVPGGIEAYFPAFQRPAQGIVCFLFGAVFAVVGVGVARFSDASLMIPLTFIPIGLGILLYGVYYLGKSLRVGVNQSRLRCRRLLFGYPLFSRELERDKFIGFEIEQGATMTSGNTTTVFYRLLAKGQDGKSFPVAERLVSRSEAELLRDTYTTYMGLGQG